MTDIVGTNATESLDGTPASDTIQGLGGSDQNIIGAYQGNFLFLSNTGVFTSTSLTGARWPALVRTSDGRLAIPSAVAQ